MMLRNSPFAMLSVTLRRAAICFLALPVQLACVPDLDHASPRCRSMPRAIRSETVLPMVLREKLRELNSHWSSRPSKMAISAEAAWSGLDLPEIPGPDPFPDEPDKDRPGVVVDLVEPDPGRCFRPCAWPRTRAGYSRSPSSVQRPEAPRLRADAASPGEGGSRRSRRCGGAAPASSPRRGRRRDRPCS